MTETWQLLCKDHTYEDFPNYTADAIFLVTKHCHRSLLDLEPYDLVDEDEHDWSYPEDIVDPTTPICMNNWTPGFHVIQPVRTP